MHWTITNLHGLSRNRRRLLWLPIRLHCRKDRRLLIDDVFQELYR